MEVMDKKGVAYLERYDNPLEFERVWESRGSSRTYKDSFSESFEGRMEWHGFRNGKELRSQFHASRVNDETLKAINTDLSKIKMAPQTRMRHYNDEDGIMFDTDAYLNGDPECFINIRKQKTPSRTVRILVNTGVVSSLSASEMEMGGRALVKALAGLESKGYRTQLSVGWLNGDRRKVYGVTMMVKKLNQPFNVTRMAWPIVSPAFSRGVCFGWYERCRDVPYEDGYGTAYAYLNSDVVDRFERSLNGEVVLSIDRICRWANNGMDVEEALKKEVDRAVALSKEVRH